MICLLTLIQLTLASSLMISHRKLQQAMDKTIMNRDVNMAAFDMEYEPAIINQSGFPLKRDPFVGFVTSQHNPKARWKQSRWYKAMCAIRRTIWRNCADRCHVSKRI